MTRQKKTDRQRAQEALGVAQRRYKRSVDRVRQLNTDLANAEHELNEATALRDHAAAHPALPTTSSTTPTTEGTTQHG